MNVIQLWVLPNDGWRTYDGLKGILEHFQREQSAPLRVKVSVRTASSMWRDLFALLKRPDQPRSLSRPDVIQLPSHWTSALGHLGLLQDISGIEPAPLDVWTESVRSHCGVPGRSGVYSLPWWMEFWVLYYRKDLLKQAGVAPSVLDTWAGLHEACEKVAAKPSLAKRCFPMANHNTRDSVSLADLAGPIWSHGGDLLAREGSRAVFHREEALRGMGAQVELLAKGWMPLLAKSGRVALDIFDGNFALQFSGRCPLRAGPFAKHLAAAPPPRGDTSRTPAATANHLALIKGSSNPKESYELLRFLTSPQVASGYASTIGASSCLAGAEIADGGIEGYRAAAETSRKHGRLLPNNVYTPVLERIVDRSMEKIVNKILRRNFRPEHAREEVLCAAAELDYIVAANLLTDGVPA